jgi:hypothetical protein
MAEKKISELTAEAGTPDLNSLIEISAYSAGPTYTSKKYTLSQLKALVYNGTADNISGGAGGQLLYQSASGTTSKLSNGSSGQYLKSNGGTNAPSWDSPSAGVTGSGTNGNLVKWTGASTVGDAGSTDDGTIFNVNRKLGVTGMTILGKSVLSLLTASVNNLSIGSFTYFEQSANAGPFNITGLTGGENGRMIYFQNTGNNTWNFTNEDASSTASNRILTKGAGTIAIASRGTGVLVYDSGSSRWRLILVY